MIFSIFAFVATVSAVARRPELNQQFVSLDMNRGNALSHKQGHDIYADKYSSFSEFFSRNASLPMGGSLYPLGIYWVEVGLGSSPQQRFKVALDTGSCTFIVPSNGCNGCAQSANRYDSSKSQTVRQVSCDQFACSNACSFGGSQCTFSNSYETCVLNHPTQPCTISGPVWDDEFHLGPFSARSTFGAITQQTKNFQQLETVDGILGLACHSSFGSPIPLTALAALGMIENKFSFCFGKNKTLGKFVVGGFQPSSAAGPFQFMPNVGGSMYGLPLSGIQVGISPVGPPISGAILDSGTNVLLLEDYIYANVVQSLKTACSTCPGLALLLAGQDVVLTSAQVLQYPTITLHFQRYGTLKLTAPAYVVAVATGETNPASASRRFGILDTGNGGFTIIGDTLMWQYVTLIDRPNNQIGFAPVNEAGCQ